jgi:hypothetical protein
VLGNILDKFIVNSGISDNDTNQKDENEDEDADGCGILPLSLDSD